MRISKMFSIILLLVIAFVAVTGLVSADEATTLMCNPGGHEVMVHNSQIPNKLEHGWTYPPCTPDDEDEDDDDEEVLPVLGCTDSTALNFNPSATQDDGTCVYDEGDDDDEDDDDNTQPIYGCMDETALNFDASATEDDGSCVYEEDDNEDDDDETPVVPTPAPSTSEPAEQIYQPCLDANGPFLQADGAFLTSARSEVLHTPVAWNDGNIDLSGNWGDPLIDTVAEDLVRIGNWSSMVCADAIPEGNQIILAYFNGELAGYTLVYNDGESVWLLDAAIIRWDLIKQDPLNGAWN